MAEALYRKWRPGTLSDLVGQDHVAQTLRQAVLRDRVSHAYMFCGPRGTGKTSTARILAKAVNCLSPIDGEPDDTCHMCLAVNQGRAIDLIEIDAASNRRIADVRDLTEKIHYSPNEAKFKVFIIDEVHMLTQEAFNALLKTLEEPPPQTQSFQQGIKSFLGEHVNFVDNKDFKLGFIGAVMYLLSQISNVGYSSITGCINLD
jgi:DNA polymerase-3 subunit gamma/tau